jgi:hypothetical protein
MPSRTILRDLKDRIPMPFFEKNLAVQQICTVLGVKKTTVYNSLDFILSMGRRTIC